MRKLLIEYLIVSISLLLSFPFLNAQTQELLGTWNIIEFSMSSPEGDNLITEENLTKEGSIWDLFFLKDGKFKQTSNMSGRGTLDSQVGSWKVEATNLSLQLEINEQKFELLYTFELEKEVLVLTRSNPMKTVKMISKFRKK